jgi:isoquinoline 1-oxidoreductase beta subunit
MLTVVVAHPPKFGATVSSFSATRALAISGVVEVRQIPSGVAVYGEDTYAAIQGRQALDVTWDETGVETRSSEELFALLSETAQKPGLVAAEHGNARVSIDASDSQDDVHRVQAEYWFPYLAHASMEPLDALIENDPEADGVLVTMGSQGPGRDRPAFAASLGLEPEQVRIDNQLAGGSFGRRSQGDASFAKEVSNVFMAQSAPSADRRPTKLIWTREDDIQGGYYRPMVVHRMDGAIDQSGKIVGWDQTISGQSFVMGTPMEARTKGGIDPTLVEGASDLAYQTDNLRVTQQLVKIGIPTLWWRSVGHTHTAFAVEAFVDELLESAGIDAVTGRLALLGEHPRHQAVLRRAAEMANWGRRLDDGVSLGVAVHKSFRTVVAQVAEIERVSNPDRPKVRRVWCAVDCGIAVNPNVIRAQMEGGIGFGLGPTLYSEIQIAKGGSVVERNFDRYKNLRIHDMPEVEVAIMKSDEDPTGVGEPGVPPIAPAVANAWRRLTGKRVSRLPMVRG